MYYVARSRGNLINPVWIELDSSILYEKSTLFCDKVANQNQSDIFGIENILEKINFEILTDNRFLSGDEWKLRKEIRKAEIMALNTITTDKIKGITYGK